MKNTNKMLALVIVFTIGFMISCLKDPIESVSGDSLVLSEFAKSLASLDFQTKAIHPDTLRATTLSSDQIPTSRDELNKMRTVVKMYNGKENAGISLPGFGGLKLGKEESSLNVYYIESKIVQNANDSIVYGCGYSIHYLFKKVEKGISIDNVPSVAASAQLSNNKTQVFYSMQTYGMSGNSLVKYFKPTINKNFNVEGFGSMQSSIDGIHTILGDTTLSKSVKFEPEILKFVRAYELAQ